MPVTAVKFRLSTKALYLNCTRDASTTSSESHVVAAWNWKTIFTLYLTSILLFNLHKISDNELSFRDITLSVTDDHISTSVYYKETNTHNYLYHQSSHPSHCKTGLPRSQLLRLRHLCSKESDFLEKGGEMEPLFEQRGQSHALLQNDLQAIRQIERIDVLNNHRPSNQSSDRILLVLTYHPLNERIKIILIRTFNTLNADPETREFFSKLPLVAYHCDGNFCDILVRTRQPTQFSRGYISVLHTYQHVSSDSKVCAPQCSFGVKKAFSCQTSCLVYCISCGRCDSIYMGVMGRTLRQRFGEHLRSIEKNLPGFPVAEHFSTTCHSIHDALVRGIMLCGENVQRKRLEMRLIFHLGISHPRGLNSDFPSVLRGRMQSARTAFFFFFLHGEGKNCNVCTL